MNEMPPPFPDDSPLRVPRGFVKDPTDLTRRLVGLLWAYLALAAIAGLLSAISLFIGEAAMSDPEQFTTMDLLTLLVGLPQLLVTAVTGVVFLMWIHRANRNARGFGAQDMRFTPGWSVGWYFVPIANLWKPYQAMKEIWQASQNPAFWQTERTPNLLGAWWGLWVSSSLLSQAAFRASLRADTSAEMVISEVVVLLSDIVDIPLCLVAMRLVRGIFGMQRQRAEEVVSPVCTVCQQPVPVSEMICVNNAWVCAACKPLLLQRMREGA